MSGSRATAALRAGSSISSGKPQLDSATKTPLSIKTMPSAGSIIFPSAAVAWPAVISSISRSPIGTRQKTGSTELIPKAWASLAKFWRQHCLDLRKSFPEVVLGGTGVFNFRRWTDFMPLTEEQKRERIARRSGSKRFVVRRNGRLRLRFLQRRRRLAAATAQSAAHFHARSRDSWRRSDRRHARTVVLDS